jgi:NitT/TauT family transport system substrate-binding protein
MKRSMQILGIFIVLSAIVAGGTAIASNHHASLTKVSLQLKWVAQSQFMGYFVALKKGYYKKAGLDVTLLNGGPNITPETVVEDGGAQFGLDWLPSLLHERDAHRNIVNIAQIFQTSSMRMISFKKLHIKGVKDFKGHTIGVWPGGNQYMFFALMHKLGFKGCDPNAISCPKKYGFNVVSEGFTMQPFLNGQLDVSQALTYNELGVVTEKPPSGAGIPMKDLNILNYNKLGVSMLEDGIFAEPSWVTSHKATTIAFLKASIEGWAWAVKHAKQAGQISYQYIPKGTATEGHMIYQAEHVAPLVTAALGGHPIGWMNPASYKRTWTEAKQDGVITKAPSGAYNQSYWKAATKGM